MNIILPWLPLIGPVLGALVAVFGWFIAHRLNMAKDLAVKRRDLRVQYLIEAYRRLEAATYRSDDQSRRDFESALADIQLLGNEEQVRLAHELSESMTRNGSATINPLLEGLRKDLRRELAIGSINRLIKVVRLGADGPKPAKVDNALKIKR